MLCPRHLGGEGKDKRTLVAWKERSDTILILCGINCALVPLLHDPATSVVLPIPIDPVIVPCHQPSAESRLSSSWPDT